MGLKYLLKGISLRGSSDKILRHNATQSKAICTPRDRGRQLGHASISMRCVSRLQRVQRRVEDGSVSRSRNMELAKAARQRRIFS